jgi:hypothetical protein
MAVRAQRSASRGWPSPAAQSARQRSYIGHRIHSWSPDSTHSSEQLSGGGKATGAQLELAEVESDERVGDQFTALVGHAIERREDRTRLLELAAPDVALAGDPLGRCRDVAERADRDVVPLAEVRDRAAAQRGDPGCGVQRVAYDAVAAALGGLQGLHGALLGVGQPLDTDNGVVLGDLREYGRANRVVVAALLERPCEQAPDLVVRDHRAAREKHQRDGA